MMMHIIVAMCQNNGIGFKNKIPWRIYEDLNFFKFTTLQTKNSENVNVLIMGRKTFESLNYKPLKGRINIIISKTLNPDKFKNVLIFENIQSSIEFVKSFYRDSVENIFFIGGEKIYEEALKLDIQSIYITKIDKTFECDAFFPKIELELI